jgi:hypothetical protein
MNRPELLALLRHAALAIKPDPEKKHSQPAAVITTEVANGSSLRYSGPTRRSVFNQKK